MKVKSYACEKDRMLYVVMPAFTNPDTLPEEVKSVTGKLTPFREFELSKERPPIALDSVKALADLAAKGYHLTKVRIIFEEKSGGERT
jgi:hypothetical protein